ncbi:MAG: glycosyltransferase family 9 protein [Bacteroidales bacterium]|jgi:ADP-heptose:LPS heptosyltransferase|nr:glycosyltransferase family 9 protein [Bacteroidales bacterium]
MQKIRFLIIRFSSIGDIVLTTPVVRCLKNQLDGAEIHYLTKPQFREIVEGNPWVDKVHVLQKPFAKTIRELKYLHFDYVIDLHKNLRSFRVKNQLKIISFSFDKLNKEKWLMVNFKKNRLPALHIVDRYLKTLSVFDVQNDGKGLDYHIPEKDRVDVRSLSEELVDGFVGVVVGAYHNTKKLTPEKIISICQKIDRPVVLLGGPADRDDAEKIKKAVGQNLYNACGIFNINQSASLVEQANVILTPDTGLMHIASAFKKKIVSVWGNTIPEFGMYPYLPDPQSEIMEIKGLKCRPCTKIGFAQCPKKHFKCILDLDVDYIAQRIRALY